MKSLQPLKLTALLLTPLLLAPLTACGNEEDVGTVSTVVKQNYIVAKPNEELRKCADRPTKREIKTNVDVSQLLADAFAYGDDCKAKHDSTWKSIDDATARAAELNKEPPR